MNWKQKSALRWNSSPKNHFPIKLCTGEICNNYEEYLKSEHWKNLKQKYYESDLPKGCLVCKSNSNISMHHRTYKRLGSEYLIDIVPVCQPCHDKIHQTYYGCQELRSNGLWSVTNKVKGKHRKKMLRKFGYSKKQFNCLPKWRKQELYRSFNNNNN